MVKGETEFVSGYNFWVNIYSSQQAFSYLTDIKYEQKEMEHLLLMLSYSTTQISFEIIADSTSIRLQFVTRTSDQLLLVSQLKAYFPACICTMHFKTDDIINGELEGGTIIDFGLSEEFMRPLAMARGFDLDPFTGLFGILEHLHGDDDQGNAFFMDAPDMLPLAKEKISCPLFAVTLRVVGQSATQNRTTIIAVDVRNAVTQ